MRIEGHHQFMLVILFCFVCFFLGYEGKFCEEQFNACDSMVCHNGGSCLIAHDGRAHCSCSSGFVGLHCEEELTGCDSSPCVHGICVDQTHGYRCFCQPGEIHYFPFDLSLPARTHTGIKNS